MYLFYCFLHLQVSQSISLLFRLVFIWFVFFFCFSSEWKTVKNMMKRKKCRTATTVTSLSRRRVMHPFVRGWRVMRRARQERKNHNVCDCHAPLCREASSVSYSVTLHIWLSFIPQVRPLQSSWLYIRNTHTQEESGFLVQLVSRFLDVNRQKQILNNCRFSLWLFVLLLFWWHLIFLCFRTNKKIL